MTLILPVCASRIAGKEQVAVACTACRDIKLVNLQRNEAVVAFSTGFRFPPARMCTGEGATVLVYSLHQGEVMQLNVSRDAFTGPALTQSSGMSGWCHGMCYVPEPINAVVLSDGLSIKTVALSDGETLWEVTGVVDGEEVCPWGLFYSAKHRAVLVCDGGNPRVLVLDPRDGSHHQTLELPDNLGEILDMCLHLDQVILQHRTQSKEKLSFFSIK